MNIKEINLGAPAAERDIKRPHFFETAFDGLDRRPPFSFAANKLDIAGSDERPKLVVANIAEDLARLPNAHEQRTNSMDRVGIVLKRHLRTRKGPCRAVSLRACRSPRAYRWMGGGPSRIALR